MVSELQRVVYFQQEDRNSEDDQIRHGQCGCVSPEFIKTHC